MIFKHHQEPSARTSEVTVPCGYARGYLVLLLIMHAGLLGYGAVVHGPGWDEIGHLPAGLSHWYTGRFDLYRVNPPFPRMVATAPLLFCNVKVRWQWNPVYNFDRPEWDLGRELVEAHGPDTLRLLAIARWACIPFSCLALVTIYLWSVRLFGHAGGMLSATLWAFSPTVLTNAQMIIPDTAAAAFGVMACYAYWRWLEERTGRWAVLSGLMLGLAELTKFTWLILFAVMPMQWLAYRVLSKDGPHGRSRLRTDLCQLAGIFAVAIYVMNLGYGFEGSFKPLREYQFYSSTLGGQAVEGMNKWIPGNRFDSNWMGWIPVLVPENFIQGIDRQKLDFELELPSYLAGTWRNHGWWYYYLYAMCVKVPLPFLLLGLLAIVDVMRRRLSTENLLNGIALLAPSLVLFVFVSSQTGFNHHLRYVLPAFPGFCIGIGSLGRWISGDRWIPKLAVVGLAAAGVGSSLSIYPHTHAYFNTIAGGPWHGAEHLLGSNLDWGQDLLLLERWCQENPDKPLDGVEHSLPEHLGVRLLTTIPQSKVPPAPLRASPSKESHDLPSPSCDTTGPLPGRYALSVDIMHSKKEYMYFQALTPSEHVGYTIRIYEVDLATANRLRSEMGLVKLDAAAVGAQ